MRARFRLWPFIQVVFGSFANFWLECSPTLITESDSNMHLIALIHHHLIEFQYLYFTQPVNCYPRNYNRCSQGSKSSCPISSSSCLAYGPVILVNLLPCSFLTVSSSKNASYCGSMIFIALDSAFSLLRLYNSGFVARSGNFPLSSVLVTLYLRCLQAGNSLQFVVFEILCQAFLTKRLALLNNPRAQKLYARVYLAHIFAICFYFCRSNVHYIFHNRLLSLLYYFETSFSNLPFSWPHAYLSKLCKDITPFNDQSQNMDDSNIFHPCGYH